MIAPLVDDDHRVRHGVEDRLQMRLASGRIAARSLQQPTEPRNADAEGRERRGTPELGHKER